MNAKIVALQRRLSIIEQRSYSILNFGPCRLSKVTRYRVEFDNEVQHFFSDKVVIVAAAHVMLFNFRERVAPHDLRWWIEKTAYRLMIPDEVVGLSAVDLPLVGTIVCPTEDYSFEFDTMSRPRRVSLGFWNNFRPPGTYFGVINQK